MYQNILLQTSGSIATITFNRPEFSNAFAAGTYDEVPSALSECGSNAEIRAIILTGAGKHFSAGGDIHTFKARIEDGTYLNRGNVVKAGAMADAVRLCPKPVIAMVNGAAAGAGCALALACDFRVMTPKSRLGLSFINMGFPGDTGAMYYLQRMVGTAKTLELMAFGSMISGEEAYRLGLATQLVPEEQLHQAAEDLARQLASKPTQAIARQKRLMYEFFYRELSAFHQREADFMREASMTNDHKEAVDAFLEKRSPQFSGT